MTMDPSQSPTVVYSSPPESPSPPQQTKNVHDLSVRYNVVDQKLAGGLRVSWKFVRGGDLLGSRIPSMGMSGVNSFLVKVKFENLRSDNASLRRVRLVNRSPSTSSVKKVVCPREVELIKAGETGVGYLGFDFGTGGGEKMDGVKLEAKTDRGSFPFEFKIPVGEQMRGLNLDDGKEFETHRKRLGGFQVTAVKLEKGVEMGLRVLGENIMDVCNISKVGEGGGEGRFAGVSSSGDEVLIVVTTDELRVHSDNAVRGNNLAEAIKLHLNR